MVARRDVESYAKCIQVIELFAFVEQIQQFSTEKARFEEFGPFSC